MSLYSFSFLTWFGFLLLVLVVIQKVKFVEQMAPGIQVGMLLVFSYFCIFLIDWRFLVCTMAAAIIIYFAGYHIDAADNRKTKSIWLGGSGAVLILILAYFKYAGFFINSFRQAAGAASVDLDIIFPIGISFYIFSALAYLIDIYREEYDAERNMINLALYISFFPKLAAGPIVRGGKFFPQVKEYRGIQKTAVLEGLQIFVFGLFLKIVLADHLGVFVDDVFKAPTAFDTGTVMLAAASYSLQIYFDFSGYSDMAVGLSKILGFDFEPNFNLPYISRDISEFWARWHISLSSWLKDYLYIPLGGSRKGKAGAYINLIIVMLISGLWHGAGWTFVIWGALHGAASCMNKAFGNRMYRLGRMINTAATFAFVTLFWVVFRADNFDTAVKVWGRMFTWHSGINQPYTWSFFAIVCFVAGTAVAYVHSKKIGSADRFGELQINGFYPVMDLSKFWQRTAFFTFCGLTIIMGYFGNTAFIYGAF